MAFISGADYYIIASDYANAFRARYDSKDELFNAVYTVVQLNAIRPEVDLLSDFWESYLVNSDLLQSTTLLLGAVRALQEHVIAAGGFATVDAYLDDQGITVPADFALLSDDAGFPIDPTNIDP